MLSPATAASGEGPAEDIATSDGLDTPVSERAPARTRVLTPEVNVWRRMVEIWASRELLVYLIRKELTVKYKNSALGFLWSMLNPALTLAVFYFVFQIVLKSGIPHFAVYLMCGLLVWNLFSSSVPSATTSVVANAGIVKKVAFPREILALASIGAALVFFFLQAIVLVLALAIFRLPPDPSYLPLLVPALLALLVFAGAVAVFLSAVNVYFRDTQHLLEVALVAWFWATPIVYSYRQIGDELARRGISWILLLNPITPIALTFQRAIYGKVSVITTTSGGGIRGGGTVPVHTHPTLLNILPAHGQLWYLAVLAGEIVVAALLFIGALAVFGRLEGNFAEEL